MASAQKAAKARLEDIDFAAFRKDILTATHDLAARHNIGPQLALLVAAWHLQGEIARQYKETDEPPELPEQARHDNHNNEDD